jgi:branched-chain amino acid transport system substrate-binding protein
MSRTKIFLHGIRKKKRSLLSLLKVLSCFVVVLYLLYGCTFFSCKRTSSAGTQDKKDSNLRPMPRALGNSAEHTSTIRIGVVLSLTGEITPWGIEALKGIQLAVDEFNNQGGYRGKPVEILVGDSGSKPEQGRSVAAKLIGKGVIGIVGELTSGISAQVAKAGFEKGIPVITVGGTRRDLSDIGANFFRVCFTDDFQGPVMAKFAYEELHLRKMALFVDRKQPYSLGLGKGFRNKFRDLGGKVIDEEYYESGQTQFGAQLTNVKSKMPDGLFIGGYYPEVGPIVRQARNLGLKVPVLGGDGWDNEQILVSGGTAIIGGYYCSHFSMKEKRPEVENFVKKWRTKYNDFPKTITSALGYDSTKLMLDALRRTQVPNSRNLLLAIENTENFPGVTGKISLKGYRGNPPKRAVILALTANGPVYQKSYEYAEVMKP